MKKPYGLQFRLRGELTVRWFESPEIRKRFKRIIKKSKKVDRIKEMYAKP